MQFSDKLNFLMTISNTTNSALSLQVSLDASYISRLRRGKRSAVKDENCLRLMADYFTRRCGEEYQRKALAEMLNIDFLSLDTSNISELIFRWLMDGEKAGARKIEIFLNEISNISVRTKIFKPANIISMESSMADTEFFYGLEGKRLAVECFLSEVLAQKQAQTLLLYSDEPTDWMTADRKFAAKWATLMLQLLAKNNRIIIIHTVSRDFDEMLHAIIQWMPLYMTGLIEPYYYPKKRDGIYKRTLFIAPNTSAVVSSSVGSMISKAANFYVKNKAAVGALAEEFNQYLNLCSPLMNIFTSNEKRSYINTLLEFEKKNSNSIIITESLSLLTMPETIALNFVSRIKNTAENISELARNRITNFKQQLQNNLFTEIVRIFDIEKIKNGGVKKASSDMLIGEATYYTLEEYILHLENIRYLLNNYENYNIHLTKEPIENRYMIYAKEDMGTIIAKTSEPPVAVVINESNLTAGFWDYLRSLIDEKAYRNPNKKESSDKLNEYIHRLKEAL